MKFTVNYTLRNFQDGQKLYFKNSKARILLIILSLLGILLCAVSILSEEFSLLHFILGIVLIFEIPILTYLSRRRIFKKSKGLRHPIEFEVNEEGVSMKSSEGSGAVKWDAFSHFHLNDKILVLYRFPVTYFFPRDSFQTEDEWQKLISIVASKVKQK